MILFWLICAGLAAIALAFVLPTLLQREEANNENNKTEANVEIYRDQLRELEADLINGIVSPEQYRQDRDEIERRLLDDVADSSELRKEASPAPSQRAVVYAVAFGIPVVAVVLYLLIGTSAALSGVPPQAATTGNADAARMTQQGIEANVAVLAKRLEQNPNDADGWTMLGRSYITLEKYREASDAYAKASALKGQDADILVQYAFALAMANNRQLQGQPTDLIKRALQIAPENPQALELAGEAEFEAKNYKQAIAYWQKVLEKSSGNAQLTKAISERINEAKSLAGAAAK
jgi:cytochrome c-type biogenesis protein CcmH